MSYATQQDMVNRFGGDRILELTDRSGSGQIDETVLGGALADADQVINGYLAVRYKLPLAETPQLVTIWACDIALSRLYPDVIPDLIQARHDDAIASLKAVVAGTLTLELDDVPEPEQPSIQAKVVANDRVFTRDGLETFIDGSRLYR